MELSKIHKVPEPKLEELQQEIEIHSSHLDRSKQFEKVRTTKRFIVDDLFECGELHIIGGASGSGKTSWLLPMIKDWSEGKDILGHKSHPAPYVYLSCDRSFSALEMTLKRLGLSDWKIHGFTFDDLDINFNLDHTELDFLDMIQKFPSEIEVFFIDAIGWFTPTGNKATYVDILKFWSKIKTTTIKSGKTIIGTTHCPKSKPGEGYSNPRDRLHGSVAQAAIGSTIIVFDTGDEKDITNKQRFISVCPRNSRNVIVEHKLDDNGRLIYVGEVDLKNGKPPKDSSAFEKIYILQNFPKGELLKTDDMVRLAEKSSVSRATMFRKIEKLKSEGYLSEGDKGNYIVSKVYKNSYSDLVLEEIEPKIEPTIPNTEPSNS